LAFERETEAVRARYRAEIRLSEAEVRLAKLEADSAKRIAQLEADVERARSGKARDDTDHDGERKRLEDELTGRDEHIEELVRELGVLRGFSRKRARAYYKERVTQLGHRLSSLDRQLERLTEEMLEVRELLYGSEPLGSEGAARRRTAKLRYETLEGHSHVTSERRSRLAASLRQYEQLLSASSRPCEDE
jgi:hypothetical protein